jgi:cytochrome P450
MSVVDTVFGPGDLANAADPSALLQRERAKGPVLRSENAWIVLGRREVELVLRCPDARSGFMADIYRQLLPPGAARDEMSTRINFLDPPDHGRVRGLVAKAFTPKRVSELRPFLRRTCDELLARLDGREKVDLIAEFAHEVPALAISQLLGVPAEDRNRLTVLSDQVAEILSSGASSSSRRPEALAAAEELHTYLRALLDARRRDPAGDLISAVLGAREDDAVLTVGELGALCAAL